MTSRVNYYASQLADQFGILGINVSISELSECLKEVIGKIQQQYGSAPGSNISMSEFQVQDKQNFTFKVLHVDDEYNREFFYSYKINSD